LLQGTNEYNVAILTLFVTLLISCFIKGGTKLVLPSYFVLAIIFYSFYLLIGIFNFHENPFIDIKFQIFSFLFFFWFINKGLRLDILDLLFTINTITFLLYMLLLLNIIPNIWNESTIGHGGRIYGPVITPILFILFYYLLFKKHFDKKLVIASVMGVIYVALTTNFMNLAVVVILLLLLAINFKKLFKPLYITGFFLITLISLWYLNSPYVPELVSTKMEYIYKPWEYGSLKTRIEDFNKAIKSENFNVFKQVFGEGFGASTSIYRENKIAPSLSRTFNFQEIDNGFYYLYHRGGWSLLSIFFISQTYLIFKIKGIKAKLGFIAIVFITNILSIHYFNYYFYLLIPFFIIYRNRISEKIKEYNP
jgi:hypothetical protein